MADAWVLPPREPPPEAVPRASWSGPRGELAPGRRIVEASLAAKLGVSRGPLRGALKCGPLG